MGCVDRVLWRVIGNGSWNIDAELKTEDHTKKNKLQYLLRRMD